MSLGHLASWPVRPCQSWAQVRAAGVRSSTACLPPPLQIRQSRRAARRRQEAAALAQLQVQMLNLPGVEGRASQRCRARGWRAAACEPCTEKGPIGTCILCRLCLFPLFLPGSPRAAFSTSEVAEGRNHGLGQFTALVGIRRHKDQRTGSQRQVTAVPRQDRRSPAANPSGTSSLHRGAPGQHIVTGC